MMMRFLELLVPFVFLETSSVVHAWIGTTTTTTTRHRKSLAMSTTTSGRPLTNRLLTLAKDSGDDGSTDDNEEDDVYNVFEGPEKSSMLRYVSEYLKKQNDKENENETTNSMDSANYCTHLIALPLDACHELCIELESVQRGILYHCPILVHSCIVGSMTRLPLLYVQANNNESDSRKVTSQLKRIVQRAVDTLVDASLSERNSIVDSDDDDAAAAWNVQFSTLEIDGGPLSSNEVLYTTAEPDHEGTKTLQKLVQVLQHTIQKELGYSTQLPTPDEDPFRPRVPFMRLPENWMDYLEQQVEQDDNIDETFMLTSDQGGNGISPILWGKWCDDVLGGEQRLREVAIYPRSSSGSGSITGKSKVESLSEREFPLPAAQVELPAGNASQSKVEATFAQYQEKRMLEAEEALQRDRAAENENVSVDRPGEGQQTQSSDDDLTSSDDDLLLTKTRQRLEKIYTMEESDNEHQQGQIPEIGDNDEDWDDIQDELLKQPQHPSDPDAIDNWAKMRIAKAVQSRARVQSELELAKKKDKPSIEENIVFAKYKDGTLVPEKEVVSTTRELPPFPSTEHCIGFWRMIGSPTGFEVEQDDASRSDNLILRVDGTTAGGPILDQDTRQKASGGSWQMTMIQDDPGTAALEIRLTIPPKKERVLVMEGKLELKSMSFDLPLARNTFGIPALEQRANAAAAAKSDELEDMVYCSGSVWIEDMATKAKNKDEIGNFSIVKLQTPTDPSQFTITVPKNVRNQD